MSQETSLQKRLIAERVRSLALVSLTRRTDLDVSDETVDVGFDLLVTLLAQEKPGVRQFGVDLQGVWRQATAEQANKALRPAVQHLLRYAPFPYPVAIFFFTMEDNQGWYTWSAEPVVGESGPELLQLGGPSCRPLDKQAVDEIVASVNHWYDAKYASYPSLGRPIRKKRK